MTSLISDRLNYLVNNLLTISRFLDLDDFGLACDVRDSVSVLIKALVNMGVFFATGSIVVLMSRCSINSGVTWVWHPPFRG